MATEFFLIAVIILIAFAVFDLMVGVSNDAVNFLNSSIGSKVAPRYIIMIIASLGILAGVTFSSSMMEVARKGIFHPQLFTMPELLIIFLAVMLTDIILLDFFNSLGLPTSTTVSIVFELLGAAVAISAVKLLAAEGSLLALGDYINTAKAMTIIFGILLSVVVAFFFGAISQFITRIVFSFDYIPRLKKYGGIWGGIAMASILYFILVKGSKGASFITPETANAIKSNTWTILFVSFAVSAVIFQVLLFIKVNILKPLILIGTFALAMAFAANDLVNFIGVPLAGLTSYQLAIAADNPLTVTMDALSKKVQTETWLLLLAGLIMVVTLWLSRKARTVTETEISLSQQEEGYERFESVFLSRVIVRMWLRIMDIFNSLIPGFIKTRVSGRLDPEKQVPAVQGSEGARFDLIRASVNLMVASAVISYATSYKLPLSTTYVTFMVAMGTSFADRAWGRESAVYRITGVLTVIGGWFMTALSAFIISLLMAMTIYYTKLYGVPVVLLLIIFIIWKNHKKHGERADQRAQGQIFNLKKIKDAPASIATTFEHMGYLIKELRESLDGTLEALFRQDLNALRMRAKKEKKIQEWCNIIVANIFKSMRLLQKNDQGQYFRYAHTVRRLQRLSDCHRDIVMRARMHVDNQHKGLLEDQIRDLKRVKQSISDIFLDLESHFMSKQSGDISIFREKRKKLSVIAGELNQRQTERIISEESKTRLSILFYSILDNAINMSTQNLRLLEIFEESFGEVKRREKTVS
jgi:phosphate/sulfate permease